MSAATAAKHTRGDRRFLRMFLPMYPEEAGEKGWDCLDIIVVSGDAYVDHPSFGAAVIARVLEDAGYRVGIIAQPDWRTPDDFKRLGKPRLFFAVTAGNVDSLVNNFTANLKRRSSDAYSPGGKAGIRPDRATIVYCNRIREAFPDSAIVIGGIEASLRRFAHYDYWQDRVRQSILADAPADILVFGMGETQIKEIAKRIDSGMPVSQIRDIPGTSVKSEISGISAEINERRNRNEDCVEIPSFDEVSTSKKSYAEAFRLHYLEQDAFTGRTVIQRHPKTVIIQNRPALPLTTKELDHIYDLPFTWMAHPSYREPIPALEPIKFSITSHRGCFAACSFCALTHHQGKIIQSRSMDSILREARRLTKMPGFAGIITDVGGPTANMYGAGCPVWGKNGACRNRNCVFPERCKNIEFNYQRQVELLKKLREIPGIRKVVISSGIRYDLLSENDREYMEELCKHHISGHLKVAPEHIVKGVTGYMRKAPVERFEWFAKEFKSFNKKWKKEQYLLPYFMSGHPGCTIEDMIALCEYIRDSGYYTEQVQDFTPTPSTISTCMYHTGIDPFTGEPVRVAKGHEKQMQRALLSYRDKNNRKLVYEALKKANRLDLVGHEWKCLVR